MKVPPLRALLSLAASFLLAPAAGASGFIVVDPVAGAPAAVAMLPPLPRPPVTLPPRPGVRPPRPAPPSRPPVTPRPNPPVLHGKVSYGLHLQSQSIRVDINNQVAKTYITQTFANDTDRNLAGTYLFPLPDDTTFSSFSLHIDGKPVEGKILEAAEARQQYEEIVRRMVDPGLLEYADYKTVRARIFPIPAHGSKKVELEYTQVLRAENGMLKYRFPLKAQGGSAPVDETKVEVKLSSAQGLRTIWSPSHTISSTRSDDHRARVSLSQRNSVPDKDFLLYYSVSDKELAANLITHKDEGDYGHFLLTLTPPVQSRQIVAKDIVLVADTSGSMQGEKLDQAKKALKHVVNGLNGGDRFNVVQFNTDVEKFRAQLVPASPENKKAAQDYIDDLEARGGTNIGDALRTGKAMLSEQSERPAYLVFMTDGEPTVGETDVQKLIRGADNNRGIRIFDFGVGYDVNTRLLNRLAEEHHGTAQYVEPQEDIETSVSSFYHKIKSPVLTDVAISYDGVQVKDVYPKAVKDIFAGSQVLLIGKYKGSGSGTVRLTGKVNGVARSFSFPLTFAAQEVGHTYLPRIWAMRRIGYLTEVAQSNGDNREIVDEIVALSRKYGIISAYTSFLVTDPSEPPPMPRPMPATAVRSDLATAQAPAGSARRMPQGDNRWRGSGGWARAQSAAPAPVRSFAGGGGREEAVFGDEGREMERPHSGAAPLGSPVNAAVSGKKAVQRAKTINEYKWQTAAASDKDSSDAGIRTIEDKTFYLRDGFWTDSTFQKGKTATPEVIAFGSQRYFDLVRTVPGISKYLTLGKNVILVFKGRAYKIVETTTARS